MNQESQQQYRSNPVWDWRNQNDKAGRLESGKLRIRAAVSVVVLSLIAALLYYRFHREIMACIPLGIAAIFLLCIAFCVPCLAAIEKGVGHFATGVGTAITWILLVPFFYLVFVSLRLILVITRQDPMFRKANHSASTYWTDRNHIADKANLERQF